MFENYFRKNRNEKTFRVSPEKKERRKHFLIDVTTLEKNVFFNETAKKVSKNVKNVENVDSLHGNDCRNT